MTIVPVIADDFPAFSIRLEGSESTVLKIFITYDGSDEKYGNAPLLVDEYWIVQSPSPCLNTLPAGLVLPEGKGFDWCYAPFEIPVGEIVLVEDSTWCRREVQMLIYCASHKNPKELQLWESFTLMKN